MKKLIFLLITLITLTNVSYASFPVIMEPVISIDTIIPDSTKINNDKPVREARPEGSKESTEEYHLRMEKQGFDVSTCMCPDCRRFKGVKHILQQMFERRVKVEWLGEFLRQLV